MIDALGVTPAVLAQVAAGDTLVMHVARDGFGTVAGVADIVVSIVLLVLLAIITVLFFQLRKIAARMHALLQRFEADPLLERSRRVAENVDFITLAVRSDVEKVNRSVAHLSERLTQASELMEERIVDFNALMEVVQGEAESAFIDTASTVRGVRAGARNLQDGSRAPRPHRAPSPRPEPVPEGTAVELDEE